MAATKTLTYAARQGPEMTVEPDGILKSADRIAALVAQAPKDKVSEMQRSVKRALVAAFLAQRGVSLALLSDDDVDELIALVEA